MPSITLNLAAIAITEERFYQICRHNPDWKLETNAKGELIIMTPVGGLGGEKEADLIGLLWLWNRQTKLGKVFSSSTIFKLPQGGFRSPDAAWIRLDRWHSLTPKEKIKFPPICPDFVIELRSPSDSLKTLQEKMQEYLDNGLQLGWLIDPQQQRVEIYRPSRPVEMIPFPASLSGESILPDFCLLWPIATDE
jgi:Uma2 family endonuclease